MREAHGASVTDVWGYLGEEVYFDQAVELSGGEFVFAAEGFEEGLVEEFGGGHADADSFGRHFGVEGGFEFDLC